MNTVAPKPRDSRGWYLWILIVFVLGVLVGWLLARRVPDKTCSAGAVGRVVNNHSGSDGAPGRTSNGATPGSPDKGAPGDMGKGTDQGSGPGRPGGASDTGGLGRTPIHPSGEDQGHGGQLDGGASPANLPEATGTLDPELGKGAANEEKRSVLQASDFRYDKTGLPRYAQSVTTTGSTLSRDAGSAAYRTTAVIVTSSRFEDVVDWYKAQLPPGWHAQVVGNLGALAQQVSMDKIMNTLAAAMQNNGSTPNKTSPDPSSTSAPANALSVAMFSPPPNSVGDPSVMIRQGTSGGVLINLGKYGTDP